MVLMPLSQDMEQPSGQAGLNHHHQLLIWDIALTCSIWRSWISRLSKRKLRHGEATSSFSRHKIKLRYVQPPFPNYTSHQHIVSPIRRAQREFAFFEGLLVQLLAMTTGDELV